jgi:hypothetical protein
MQPYLRLRQVCLAAPHLQASSALIAALLGLAECHRDGAVARYGLENAVFPVGNDRFLEVVSPIRLGTAVGRFLEQAQGRGGYMLIFDCDDPRQRALRAAGLGVRLAHHIDYATFQGYQLHPKDCRAAFIEFDNTVGGEDALGPYWPAGRHWQQHVRTGVTTHLAGAEVLSHDAAGLAAHWSQILDVPAQTHAGGQAIAVAGQTITIRNAPDARREWLDAIVLRVHGAAGIIARARQMGLATCDDAFALCGVWIRLREHGA